MRAITSRAWWVLLAISVIIALLGIGDVLGGVAFEPTLPLAVSGLTLAELEAASGEAFRVIDLKARVGGVDLVALGVLFSLVVWFPYRRGERWSWISMWLLPVWAVSLLVVPVVYGLAPGQAIPGATMSGPMLAVIAAVALVVDAGRFRSDA